MYIPDEKFEELTKLFRELELMKLCPTEEVLPIIAYDSERHIRLRPDVAEQPHIDNLKVIENKNVVTFSTDTKKEQEQMSPQYSDGSFRTKGNTLEYRFMLDGVPKSVCGSTEQICFNRRTAFIKGNIPAKKAKNTIYVAEYFRTYYKNFKIRKDGTKVNPKNEKLIETILEPRYGNMPLKDFSILHARELMKEYEDRGNRQKKIYMFLNEVFRMATNEGKIKLNPMSMIKLERHEVKSFNVIQSCDHNRILETIDKPKFYHFFWYLCCTGLRLDTAIKSLDNVDLQKCEIYVTKKDTATKKHKATIPFLPELINEESLALMKEVEYDEAERYFGKLFKSLDLELVLHSCRKVFASCAMHVGFPLKWVQNKLRHSTSKTTMDIYVEFLENNDSKIIDYFRKLKAVLKI